MAANKNDFLEADIIERKKQIIDAFIEYLKKNNPY